MRKMSVIEYDNYCGRRCRQTNIMLSDYERDVLDELCKKKDLSMTQFFRNALRDEYLKEMLKGVRTTE